MFDNAEDIMNEKTLHKIELANIYEIRLIFAEGEKSTYQREEILEMLDKLAIAKK